MSAIRSFRDLVVWQRAFALAVAAHELCDSIPRTKRGALVGQIERAAASVPANIAEGNGRVNRGEYLHFLNIAHGSLTELETHILLVSALGYASGPHVDRALTLAGEVGRLLGGLMRALRRSADTSRTVDQAPALESAARSRP